MKIPEEPFSITQFLLLNKIGFGKKKYEWARNWLVQQGYEVSGKRQHEEWRSASLVKHLNHLK